MSYKSIDIVCGDCAHQWNDLVERELVDTPQQCPDCGKMGGMRTISIPNLTKASYPDGHRRGGGYQELKEVAKLKKEAYNSDVKQRSAIGREIKKLGGSIE